MKAVAERKLGAGNAGNHCPLRGGWPSILAGPRPAQGGPFAGGPGLEAEEQAGFSRSASGQGLAAKRCLFQSTVAMKSFFFPPAD